MITSPISSTREFLIIILAIGITLLFSIFTAPPIKIETNPVWLTSLLFGIAVFVSFFIFKEEKKDV